MVDLAGVRSYDDKYKYKDKYKFKYKDKVDQIREKALHIGCHAGVTMVDLAGVQSNDHPQSHTDPRQ